MHNQHARKKSAHKKFVSATKKVSFHPCQEPGANKKTNSVWSTMTTTVTAVRRLTMKRPHKSGKRKTTPYIRWKINNITPQVITTKPNSRYIGQKYCHLPNEPMKFAQFPSKPFSKNVEKYCSNTSLDTSFSPKKGLLGDFSYVKGKREAPHVRAPW